MRAQSIRFSGLHALLAAGLLALIAIAASAAAPEGAAAKPKAGDAAPAIQLKDQDGKTHKLADYKGKWVVVYFYPKDQTPGCTTQACEFRDNIFAYRNAGAQILGVSVDDEASHAEFAEKHGLPFPLLADTSFAAAKSYGVLTQRGQTSIASRDTFLIDPNGRVAKHYVVSPDKLEGHSLEVLKDIETFKAAAKS